MKNLCLIRLFSICIIFFTTENSRTQIGIGTTSPHASAKLEIRSNNKGILLPNVALTGTNDNSTISSPASSLLVYNSNSVAGANGVSPGYYYYNGSVWLRLTVPTDHAANVTGTVAVANGGTGVTTSTGTGSVVLSNAPAVSNLNSTGNITYPDVATQTLIGLYAQLSINTSSGVVGTTTPGAAPFFYMRSTSHNPPELNWL